MRALAADITPYYTISIGLGCARSQGPLNPLGHASTEHEIIISVQAPIGRDLRTQPGTLMATNSGPWLR